MAIVVVLFLLLLLLLLFLLYLFFECMFASCYKSCKAATAFIFILKSELRIKKQVEYR